VIEHEACRCRGVDIVEVDAAAAAEPMNPG
jgi:hypothetical protein